MPATQTWTARPALSAGNVFFLAATVALVSTNGVDIPKFAEPIHNITVPVSREATLICVVEGLSTFKVAWLKVDTQTILTIATHVITKNHRIHVTHSDHRTWYLHLRDVRESDRGWYMCQINTDPMKSQAGYLDVVVPPDILDHPTSTDMVHREGDNVTMHCAAVGSPTPVITWRREDGAPIPLGNSREVVSIEGSVFNITKVNRLHMGAYLCIASNGVPPTVSKRIRLIVHFPPMIWVQNQLISAYEGQQITLECYTEAYPNSISYWTRDGGRIVAQGGRYEPVLLDNAYKSHMKLTIKSVAVSDFGTYKCVVINSLGQTDGTIKLENLPKPTTPYVPSTTTETAVRVVEKEKAKPKQREKDRSKNKGKDHKSVNLDVTQEIAPSEPSRDREKTHRSREEERRAKYEIAPTSSAVNHGFTSLIFLGLLFLHSALTLSSFQLH